MQLVADALVLAVRAHGEHGAIVRTLTEDHGLVAGFVRGGRSRRLRPVLQAGNVVQGEWRARTDAQLPQLSVELVHSRAPLHAEPLPAAAIDWLTAVTAAALPEGLAYPRLYAALGAVLDAIETAPSARGWAAALARYELLLLAELGFGLDLDRCVATGATDELAYVSPKSGGAVSRAGAAGLEHRLFALPAFLRDGGAADGPEALAALAMTGHFLTRDLVTDRRAPTLAARERLIDRLTRAIV